MSKPTRSPTNTVLGVSMPKSLKQSIKALADADNRTMAQWSAIQLARIVQEMTGVPTAHKNHLKLHPPEAPRTRRHQKKA